MLGRAYVKWHGLRHLYVEGALAGKTQEPWGSWKGNGTNPRYPEGANNQKVMTLLGTRCPVLWEKLLYVR